MGWDGMKWSGGGLSALLKSLSFPLSAAPQPSQPTKPASATAAVVAAVVAASAAAAAQPAHPRSLSNPTTYVGLGR